MFYLGNLLRVGGEGHFEAFISVSRERRFNWKGLGFLKEVVLMPPEAAKEDGGGGCPQPARDHRERRRSLY